MKIPSICAAMFFLAVNVFAQNNAEKWDIIRNNFIEIVSAYNEHKHLINDEQFEDIMNAISLFFTENNNHIDYHDGNNKIIFSKENIIMEIIPYFYLSRSTSSFNYCAGNLLINNLSYDFFLYDNSFSSNYYRITNNEKLTFRYYDLNGDRYGYINNFNPNSYELFEIRQYNIDETSTEILPIYRKIIYK